MPPPASSMTNRACAHEVYRMGCLSCAKSDIRSEVDEAHSQVRRLEEAVRDSGAQAIKGGLKKPERDALAAKQKLATDRLAAWRQRVQRVQEMLNHISQQVQRMCDAHDSSELADALEADAADREEEFRQIWRSSTREGTGEFNRFRPEDPNRTLPSKATDRTAMPANLDDLVSDGVGLETFLRHCKTMGQRLPSRAVGEQTGPAIMSYGGAIARFGVPEAPRDEESPSDENVTGGDLPLKTEPATRQSAEDAMANASIAETTESAEPPKPAKTEHASPLEDVQLRPHNGQPTEPTTSSPSDEQRWGLFSSTKFMVDTAMLVRQYVKLVKDKALVEEKTEEDEKEQKAGATSAVPGGNLPVDSAAPSNDEWPPAGDLEWVGLTDWIQRCRDVDRKFGRKTVGTWRAERRQLEDDLVKGIKKWTDNPPADFDDGSTRDPKPWIYFPHNTTLAKLDAEKTAIWSDREDAKRKREADPAVPSPTAAPYTTPDIFTRTPPFTSSPPKCPRPPADPLHGEVIETSWLWDQRVWEHKYASGATVRDAPPSAEIPNSHSKHAGPALAPRTSSTPAGRYTTSSGVNQPPSKKLRASQQAPFSSTMASQRPAASHPPANQLSAGQGQDSAPRETSMTMEVDAGAMPEVAPTYDQEDGSDGYVSD